MDTKFDYCSNLWSHLWLIALIKKANWHYKGTMKPWKRVLRWQISSYLAWILHNLTSTVLYINANNDVQFQLTEHVLQCYQQSRTRSIKLSKIYLFRLKNLTIWLFNKSCGMWFCTRAMAWGHKKGQIGFNHLSFFSYRDNHILLSGKKYDWEEAIQSYVFG